MRTQLLCVFLLVFCLDFTGLLLAQAPPATTATTQVAHAPDPDSGMGGHVQGLFIPLVTGAPFHARILVHITRRLPDGATVEQKYRTPNAPVSAEQLRAEERAWDAMRDAWTTFMAVAFPNKGNLAGFATMLTQQHTMELIQIQNIERNRGCAPAE